MIKVQMDEEVYRLVEDGNEGDIVSYGEPAYLNTGKGNYICHVDDPDTVEPEVFQLTKVLCEVEEVDFEGLEEAAEDEEEEEDEDDEEGEDDGDDGDDDGDDDTGQ